jgi:hypothetical protein
MENEELEKSAAIVSLALLIVTFVMGMLEHFVSS